MKRNKVVNPISLGYEASNVIDKIYKPITCRNTSKEFRLIDCLSCQDLCPEMIKALKSPSKRRIGVIQGK